MYMRLPAFLGFFLYLSMLLAYSPAGYAQVEAQRKAYHLSDSSEVIRLLLQGKELLADPATMIVSAQYFGSAFRLSQNIGYYTGQGEALKQLAILSVHQKPKYSHEAMKYFGEALEIWQARNDTYQVAETYSLMGDAFAERWNYHSEAVGYYKQSLAMAEKLRKTQAVQGLRFKITKSYLKIGNLEKAQPYLKPLRASLEKAGNHEALAELDLALAQYWADKDNLARAKEIVKKAQKSYTEHGGSPEKFTQYLQHLESYDKHTRRVTTSDILVIIGTVLVIGGVLVGSYFYARKQVKAMQGN